MKKKEMLEKLEPFSNDSDVLFVMGTDDLLRLDDEGMSINVVVEINNGRQKVIAIME